jgi:hypothetical protein
VTGSAGIDGPTRTTTSPDPEGDRRSQRPSTLERVRLTGRDFVRTILRLLNEAPRPVAAVLVLSTLFNLIAFNQGDLNHTVGSSYAYLNGHALDFYDYNREHFAFNDYFPTIYIVFAIWMAPVKLLVSPGVQNGTLLSSWEVLWAKSFLLIVFLATVYVLSKIARDLFADRPHAQRNVLLAYALSPFAAFAFNAIGQYDVIGVLFTLIGFRHYLRGNKWQFALFFALAASLKYFALIIFAPLLLLRYKRFRDLALLSLVALSVIAIEALVYLSNAAFREETLFGLAGQKVADSQTQSPLMLVGLLFVAGCIVLWRARPPADQLGMYAVFSAAMAFGVVFVALAWNPQWFMLLTPFFALSLGYLRRPGRFLLWESVVFFAFIGVAVNRWPGNVDSTMVDMGALRSVLDSPVLLLSDLYPAGLTRPMEILIAAYLLSPIVFFAVEQVSRRPAAGEEIDRPVGTLTWLVRACTLPLAFTLPTLFTVFVPVSAAAELNPGAATNRMTQQSACAEATGVHALHDGADVQQTFRADSPGLGGVSVLLGTFGPRDAGEITLRLVDSDGNTLGESSTALASVNDNSPVYLVLDTPLANAAGAELALEVETRDVPAEPGVALWGTSADCFDTGALTLDGVEAGGDLRLDLFYQPVTTG